MRRILLTDANGAPGTVATAGTSVSSSQEYLPELLTYFPVETTSMLTGLEPWAKNSSPPPGAKKACSDASSGTRSEPKVTSPSALPIPLAREFFGQPWGPMFLSVASAQVAKPDGWSVTPLGRNTLTAETGGGLPFGFCAVTP